MQRLPLSTLLENYVQKVEVQLAQRLEEPLVLAHEERAVLALSEFVSESLLRNPQWLFELRQAPPSEKEGLQYQSELTLQLQFVDDETTLMQILRQFRCQKLVRISYGQTLNNYSTEATLLLLSRLAEALITSARNWVYQAACREWGTPTNDLGISQPLLVLAMGKLGGYELNFSSDIDLIFIYPENGMTQGGRRQLDNMQFFTRVGQRLIKVLDRLTVDGQVYRVDMRLRPFGDSGPLVMSFAALEEYYQEQGRDWERYAMIKARVIGSTHQGYDQSLHQMLRPFIFRRYIDFSVIQSLRNMKEMINREVRRRGLIGDIKLGAGGIRQIEFITQVFQLIRGGREPSLQGRSLLPTLTAIAELELLPVEQTDKLRKSYLFLRRLENLLQAIADKQTQTLPDEPLDQARLAWGMGYRTWPLLLAAVQAHMLLVVKIFEQLIDQGDSDPVCSPQSLYSSLWLDQLEESEVIGLFPDLSPQILRVIFQRLVGFRQDLEKRAIGLRGRDVLDQLMPRLLADICYRDDVERLLPRLFNLLLSIVTRTTYLELLLEYRSAMIQLIRLCAASPMIASRLARYPILLDELLTPSSLYHPIPLADYKDELRQYLLRIDREDEEQRLEALRQFKQAQILRIAAADINGSLPIMKVSDHLTYLAEAIIEAVVQQAWQDMVRRYGMPAHLTAESGYGFAVIGYGKLGGWELGYGSDLDLVFLVDCPESVMTDGERSISGSQFYIRLTQRIMHLFSTNMVSGVLYEVDARLRPSGEAGLLVSTLEAFIEYQRNEAWTWEHQALVRARMVYGDASLTQRFNALRHEILCRPRDEITLQREVCEMRQKMRRYHIAEESEWFDLKYAAGGIIDIEFIAQYLVLRYASEHSQLTQWSDNVRIFELMVIYNILSSTEGAMLTQAYISMRDEIHRLALQECETRVAASLFEQRRDLVKASWHSWLQCATINA